MNLEHVAINVADTLALVEWYTTHLEMKVVRGSTEPPYVHFLADKGGRCMLEIYSNPAAPLPEYQSMPPLMLHFAFAVEDMAASRERLIAAGATAEGEITPTSSGDQLAMLRDPWGICIQLVKRKNPMLR
jgi:glyoxylase I family protein